MPQTLNWIRWRWLALALLSIAALAGCVSLDTQQRKWIFQARTTPEAVDGRSAGLTDVWIPVADNTAAATPSAPRLHALWIDGPTPGAPLLLYLHGARRDVDQSAFRIHQMQALGFAVLAIDYRGFGRSSDELPSETSVDEDARTAWAWLATQHPGRERYLFGHSLGGAIAVRLASEVTDAKGLIVEGTFTSIPDVFQTMKWGWLPVATLITQRFDAATRIANVKVPVLVVHGEADTLIRPELGRALYERAQEPKRFILVPGGTHYSTNGRGQAQYREAVRALFGIGA